MRFLVANAMSGPRIRQAKIPTCRAPGHDVDASRSQGTSGLQDRSVARDIHDPVVAILADGVVVLGVVDDVVRAEPTHEVRLGGAADTGHVCSGGLCDLHGEGAHASRRAVDQHPVCGPDPTPAPQGLQGHDGRLRKGRGLLEGQVGRLVRPGALRGAHVLREGVVSELGQVPEHLIARSEAPDVLADRLDLPGDVEPQAGVPAACAARRPCG